MQRNVDPFRPGSRFLVRDNENNLPATTPSIDFLNQLQDELLYAMPGQLVSGDSALASKNEQVMTAVESIKLGYSFPGVDSQYRIELKRESIEKRSIAIPAETFAVHVLTEIYQRVLVSQFESSFTIGPVVIARREDTLEATLKDGVDSALIYVLLESTFLQTQQAS